MWYLIRIPGSAKALRLALIGEIDLNSVDGFRNRLFELAENAPPVVAIDASRLNYLYSDGLAVLVELAGALRQRDGQLLISRPGLWLQQLLRQSGLDRVMSVVN